MENFHYFNLGFKGDELATNFSNCGNRSAYWQYWELPTYQVKLLYGNGTENMRNTTLFIQNTTNTLYICTDAAENIYYYFLFK